ncbi:MAG: ChaN family lipoprotein, partial [Candidatus Aminicenantales bacterium]
MRKKTLSRKAILLSIILAAPLFGRDVDPSLVLKIGDPRFRDLTVKVSAGDIVSMETGIPVSFEQMIREMKPVPFVYLGETHNSLPMHELQARVIRALFGQDPQLAVGLEMYPVTLQEPLTRWSRGLLSEDEFLREGRWYATWNQNFAFYRPILS